MALNLIVPVLKRQTKPIRIFDKGPYTVYNQSHGLGWPGDFITDAWFYVFYNKLVL